MANVVRFQLRGDTAENWENVNPVLLMNELGYDRTARRFKMGDGVTAWTNLAYVEPNTTELMMNFMGTDGRTVSKYVYVGTSVNGEDPDTPIPTPTPDPTPDPAPVIDFSSAHWEVIEMPTTQIGAVDFVDYGAEVGKLLFANNRWSYIYDVNTGQCEDFYEYNPSDSNEEATDDDDDEEDDTSSETEEKYYQGYPIIKPVGHAGLAIDPTGKGVLRNGDFYRSGLNTEFKSPLKEVSNLSAIDWINNGDCSFTFIDTLWYPKKNCFIVACAMVYDASSDPDTYQPVHNPYTFLVSPQGEIISRYTTRGSNYGGIATHTGRIVYSATKNEFLGVAHPATNSISSIMARKSTDGLSWAKYTVSGLLYGGVHEQPAGLLRSDRLGVYILATQVYSQGANNGIYIYKSETGLSWEHVHTFLVGDYKMTRFRIRMSINEELNVICLFYTKSGTDRPRALLTQDLENWTEVDSGEDHTGKYIDNINGAHWSPSLQSFVCCVRNGNKMNSNPMKLVLT